MSFERQSSSTSRKEHAKSKKRHSNKTKAPELENGLARVKKRKRHADDAETERASPKKQRRRDGSQVHLQTDVAKVAVQRDSPFHRQTSSLFLPLSPIVQLHPLEGLCAEHLSPLLLTYYAPFRGVVLSYANVRLSEHPTLSADDDGPVLAKSIDECGASFIWLTADFLLLRPRRDQWIEGWINLQNESHVGLVCWNLFNASIERQRLPKDWTWSGVGGRMSLKKGAEETSSGDAQAADDDDRGQGYFVDGEGRRIEGLLRFRIKDTEAAYSNDRGFLNIEGTLLDHEAESMLLEREQSAAGVKEHLSQDGSQSL